MLALIRYHISYYIKSSKFVMPLLMYFLFMTALYATSSKITTSTMVFSASVLYFIEVWAGFVYSSVENPVSEQIIMLKSGNFKSYYRSKIIFLFIFCVFLSLVGFIFPTLKMVIAKATDSNSVEFSAALSFQFLLLHVACSFLGVMVGYFFQPRIFKNRKLMIILTIIFAVMGLVKGFVTKDIPAMVAVTWVFPPMYSAVSMEPTKQGTLPFNDFFLALGIILLYSVILAILNIYLLRKKGF